MIVVHNPTEAPVKDYPIQDPQSKEVLLWSILPGETLEFPDHVGKYLLEVYGFLQKVMTEDQYKEEQEAEKQVREGKNYSQVKIVKAEGEVVGLPTEPQAGFTNDVMQPHNAKVEPTAEDFPFTCPDKECGQKFKRDNLLKVHYAAKHLVLPTA